MKKKIVFYARSGQMRLYPMMALKLVDYDYCYIVQNDEEEKIVRSIDINNSVKIYNITKFIKEHWNSEEYLSVDLSKIEKKYNIDSLWQLFYFDRFLVKYDTDSAIKFIKLHIAFSEYILRQESPSFFVNEEIALFFPSLFAKVSRSYDCKYVGFSVPRNFSLSKILFKDDNGQYAQLNRYYKQRNVSEEELAFAKDTVLGILASKEKPEYMKVSGAKPKLTKGNIGGLLRYAFYPFNKKHKLDYINVTVQQEYINNVIFFFRQFEQRKFFQKADYKHKFILYPLHYTPEASTLVAASFYEKQLNIIDFLAKSIPGDMVLYVKEHYARIGHKETSFYKQIIKNYPNVRLIDPWLDSFELIEKSEGVAVLTSTAGWEALMFQKPVLVFGDVFYDKFKYAHKIKSISSKTLVVDIKQALSTKIDKEEYNKEFYYFFAAYLKAMKDGNYCLGQKSVLNSTNISTLTNSLKDHIEELNKSKYNNEFE